jgi:hypothetical protein
MGGRVTPGGLVGTGPLIGGRVGKTGGSVVAAGGSVGRATDGIDVPAMGGSVERMGGEVPIGGEVTPAGGSVLTGGGVGIHSIVTGAPVTGTGGELGLGVVGILSPRLTSKEVPSTLEI